MANNVEPSLRLYYWTSRVQESIVLAFAINLDNAYDMIRGRLSVEFKSFGAVPPEVKKADIGELPIMPASYYINAWEGE